MTYLGQDIKQQLLNKVNESLEGTRVSPPDLPSNMVAKKILSHLNGNVVDACHFIAIGSITSYEFDNPCHYVSFANRTDKESTIHVTEGVLQEMRTDTINWSLLYHGEYRYTLVIYCHDEF